jgi:hypothetical protein
MVICSNFSVCTVFRVYLFVFTKYYWGIKSRRMKWVGHVACMEEPRDANRILARKSEWTIT